MPKSLAKIVLLIFCTSLVLSCDNGAEFDHYQSIASGKWAHRDTVKFEVGQPDSLNTYNLFLKIRANQNYPYSNIFLITKMKFPNGKLIQDTLEYTMADPDGKLKGESYGNLTESKLWYKNGVRFPEKGVYHFSVRQATRKNGQVKPDDTLPGITDVGFRIEKTNQN